MSAPEVDAMLERSYAQSVGGEGTPIDEAFAELERELA